jgi:hypothetical protein
MKLKIIKKAWCLNASNLEEPYFCDTDELYYGTRGQAKSKALCHNDSCTLISNGDDVDYMTIRVQRVKECDVVDYHGRHVRRDKIEEIEREVRIENLPEDKSHYVQDARSYVGNSVLWWALGGNGYTCDITKAHKYKGNEVKKSWRHTDIIWESEHIENNIKQHVDMQGLDRKLKI